MNMIFNNKGITIVESLIAVFLTAVAVASLISMQPLSWQSAGRADSLSRAVGLLQQELESVELNIMTGNPPTSDADFVDKVIGSETFEKRTTISSPSLTTWLAHVHVRWKSNPKGIKSSILVSRQPGFDI
jgi:Tfp pilus assembly protein PilV